MHCTLLVIASPLLFRPGAVNNPAAQGLSCSAVDLVLVDVVVRIARRGRQGTDGG